jgi:ATHILA ORF-1 family
MHLDTMKILGIDKAIQHLTNAIHLWDFFSTEVPTYWTLTLEFLASFSHSKDTNSISFQLDGKKHVLTITDLNRALGTNPDSEVTELSWLEYPEQGQFEIQISGESFSSYRANQIQHSALYYIQRTMAYTIFGRGYTFSVIYLLETYFLYCMIYGLRNTAPEPNVGHFMVRRIKHVLDIAGKSRTITIGGVITRIAMYLKILGPESRYRYAVTGPTRLDLEGLSAMRLIKRYDSTYKHLGPNGEKVLLPLSETFDHSNKLTWLLYGDKE